MRRRYFVKTALLSPLAGIGVGCAGQKTAALLPPPAPHSSTRTPINLAVPRISWERVIRTTVGLRPHRDSGFVLRAEKFDTKTVIHDYGFGGAGMSLAWGCGAIAARMALEHGDRRAAVLGCGSPGLTAARQLQRRGFDVTIYASAIPPDTTSNMSTAGFTPTSGLVSVERRTPAWDALFREAAATSYRELQLLAGTPGYGVSWKESFNATDNPNAPPANDPEAGSDLLPEQLQPGRDREVLGPGEHPFPAKYAIRSSRLVIEPNPYLDKLVRDFVFFGGKIVIRKFDTSRDLMSLTESIIINCTGLGSKTLFNDDELVPIKGQLTVCVPQAEVNYWASGRLPGASTTASIYPRSDGIVVGNTRVRGNWSLDPDPIARQQNMDATIGFFAAMRGPAKDEELTTFEPPRVPPGLESFFGVES
jgi:glycine/D-amino acid oxidase-like deaminating enzyme